MQLFNFIFCLEQIDDIEELRNLVIRNIYYTNVSDPLRNLSAWDKEIAKKQLTKQKFLQSHCSQGPKSGVKKSPRKLGKNILLSIYLRRIFKKRSKIMKIMKIQKRLACFGTENETFDLFVFWHQGNSTFWFPLNKKYLEPSSSICQELKKVWRMYFNRERSLNRVNMLFVSGQTDVHCFH